MYCKDCTVLKISTWRSRQKNVSSSSSSGRHLGRVTAPWYRQVTKPESKQKSYEDLRRYCRTCFYQEYLVNLNAFWAKEPPNVWQIRWITMGNSLAPHLESAQKTGVCSLSGKGLSEVSLCTLSISVWYFVLIIFLSVSIILFRMSILNAIFTLGNI